MSLAAVEFSPGEQEYLYFDWSDKLNCLGVTISSSTWNTPTGLTKINDQIINIVNGTGTVVSSGGNGTRVKYSGFVLGKTYEIINTIADSTGQTLIRYAKIECSKLSGTPSNTCINIS